jgi:hypothetical protein
MKDSEQDHARDLLEIRRRAYGGGGEDWAGVEGGWPQERLNKINIMFLYKAITAYVVVALLWA